MFHIQEDLTISHHQETKQYSVWVTIQEGEKEVKFIYIFSHPFRAYYLKTDEKMLEMVRNLLPEHVKKIEASRKQSSTSIFDSLRYRFVFQSKLPSKGGRIGFTKNESDDVRITSFHFTSPEEAREDFCG